MNQRNVSLFLLLIPLVALGQRKDVEGMRYLDENGRPVQCKQILIPNVGEFQVLKCDFHMHRFFDRLVWPTIRNQEVWEEGLDAFAIHDHIEYTL